MNPLKILVALSHSASREKVSCLSSFIIPPDIEGIGPPPLAEVALGSFAAAVRACICWLIWALAVVAVDFARLRNDPNFSLADMTDAVEGYLTRAEKDRLS